MVFPIGPGSRAKTDASGGTRGRLPLPASRESRQCKRAGLSDQALRFARWPLIGRIAIEQLADLDLGDGERPLRGVFIRAPRVDEAGPDVEVLAELDGEPVLLRDGSTLVASFHPELTDDTRVHERFLDLVREEMHVRA